ncbi:DUF29 domain-containing protein [Devosia sp.]|uniref:DUF29 domain-containing protein n=1 Tax=Devosia sp. TaxID=1871048 RepID=UPI0035B231EF
MNKLDPARLAGYEDDFALWSAEQAALIRAGKFDRVDLENVAEEIESLGKSDKRQIRSRLQVLMLHLLKWERQPAERSRSWASSIRDQRQAILDLIDDSPSLGPYPGQVFERDYPRARERAAEETTIFLDLFPKNCPYTIEQILDPDYLPGQL